MTRQEAFDRNWQAFVVEQRPRAVENGSCVFALGEDRCAVGILLTDEEIQYVLDWQLNQGNLDALFDENEQTGVFPTLRPFEHDRDFLLALQDTHDGAASSESHKRALLWFAEKYHLDVPEMG